MSKSVFDVLRMLRDMDSLQVERHPLPDHYAVCCDNHCRELYATMLAAMLLANGEVSDNESRLYKLLLNSLKLGDNQAKFFELAQSINKDKLREFLRVVDEHKLAQSFFMDALVLCRLDAPMTDARSRLLSQWVDLLRLDEQQTVTLSGFAANVLGLPTTAPMDINFDHRLIGVWKEWYFKEVTIDDLKNGLKSNQWRIDDVLEVDFSFGIQNVRLEFFGKGEIKVKGAHEVQIDHSHLQMPKMLFEQSTLVSIKNTVIRGDYSAYKNSTAFSLQKVKEAFFYNLSVSTKNAQSFSISYYDETANWMNRVKTQGSFSKCSFAECGSSNLIGGAICAGNMILNVDQCRFVNCEAKLAGAIYGYDIEEKDNYYSKSRIKNSYFEDCYSVGFPTKKKTAAQNGLWASTKGEKDNGGAIFANVDASTFITYCSFVRANVNLGKLYSKSVCYKCSVEDCYVFYEDRSSSHSDQVSEIKSIGSNSGYTSGSFIHYPSQDEPWV